MIKGVYSPKREERMTEHGEGDSKSLDNYFEGFSFGLC